MIDQLHNKPCPRAIVEDYIEAQCEGLEAVEAKATRKKREPMHAEMDLQMSWRAISMEDALARLDTTTMRMDGNRSIEQVTARVLGISINDK